MKLVSFLNNGQEGFGIFSQSGIYPVLEKFKKEFPNLRAVIDSQKIGILRPFVKINQYYYQRFLYYLLFPTMVKLSVRV